MLYNSVKAILKSMQELGLIRLQEIGHEGYWEVVLVNQTEAKPELIESHQQPTRSVTRASRARGGENLELFSADERFTSKDMENFMGIWNGTIVLPKIVSMKGRERRLHELMKDQFFRENYREGIKKIAASRFCRGHNRQGAGMRPWKSTVDWFLQSHVLPRILEGKYDDQNAPELTADDQKFTQEEF